jgi:hypothetical protein
MAPRFLTILTGRNLPKIRQPRQNRQFRTNLVVRANHAAPAIAKIAARSNVAAPPEAEATPTAAKTAATEATTTETAAAKTTTAATAATSATTAAASGFRRCA